ncbi:hypothetical protein [Achromobacter sp.]|uniref:hypothetical protein n=1 Tax=Achromobacter sp. TaxID=134375 RepID=UPI000ED58609|nr:hypothetical protein [Achromobacter sp.]HCW21653.1 hypothetical protein [Achromobacter sp.]
MEELFKDVADWVGENYPAYKGWRIRSFAWEYDIASSLQEIVDAASEALDRGDHVRYSDFDAVVEPVIPPEGFAYCTLQKDNTRVGINIPCHVFQKQTQPA